MNNNVNDTELDNLLGHIIYDYKYNNKTLESTIYKVTNKIDSDFIVNSDHLYVIGDLLTQYNRSLISKYSTILKLKSYVRSNKFYFNFND
jgi:hypothetical protein